MAKTEQYRYTDVVQAVKQAKGMVYIAAKALGCSPQTIYNYARKYAAVQQEIENQRGELIDTAELALLLAIQKGEGWAIALALKTLGRDRGYEEVIRLEGGIDVKEVNRLLSLMVAAGRDPKVIIPHMTKQLEQEINH